MKNNIHKFKIIEGLVVLLLSQIKRDFDLIPLFLGAFALCLSQHHVQ